MGIFKRSTAEERLAKRFSLHEEWRRKQFAKMQVEVTRYGRTCSCKACHTEAPMRAAWTADDDLIEAPPVGWAWEHYAVRRNGSSWEVTPQERTEVAEVVTPVRRPSDSITHTQVLLCPDCWTGRKKPKRKKRRNDYEPIAWQRQKMEEVEAKRAKAELRRFQMRRTHSHVRRARELQAHGEHSTREWELKLQEFKGCCAYCGAEGDMQRDHFVPISRGGSNYIDNIVPACGQCNASKGAKTGAEFMTWLRQRIREGMVA
jgi:5-methylcytosine-specific restriction endonuclease McrA